MKKLLHEPLFHFTILALFIFLGNYIVGSDDRETVFLDAATQEYLINQREQLLMRPLLANEKKQVIDTFLEEELLIREAKKRGLTDNVRIRTLLLQNMRFLLRDDLVEPTDEELLRFYQDNPQLFEFPRQISFDQVYFQVPSSIPVGTLESLNAGTDHLSMGDSLTNGQPTVVKATAQGIASSFEPEHAAQILGIEDDKWHGPFISPMGAHFLRVRGRQEPLMPRLEDVRDWAVMKWKNIKHKAKLEQELAAIKQEYIIEIEPLEGVEK